MELAAYLVKNGYKVKGSNRTNSNAQQLKAIGTTPFIVDIANHCEDLSSFLNSEVLIIAITSKNIADFKQLVPKIENAATKKVIFISSTSVYPNTNNIVTETTPVIDCPLAEIEQLFLSAINFQTTIIRFSGLFGGNRKPGNFLKADKKTKNPEGYINLIHRNDCLRIIDQVVSTNSWDTIINACTDTHPTRREFYSKEAEKLGNPPPLFDESTASSYKIISNEKLKSLLNFEFEYPNLMNL